MGVDWESLLAPHLLGRVTVVAVGDRWAGDDGAGSLLVDRVAGKIRLGHLDCGSYPQNFLSVIARTGPESVMVVDAAELGLPPGRVRLIERADLLDWGGSHGIPMALLLEQIEALTGASVVVLGIQIGSLTPGEGLHPAVEAVVGSLADFLIRRYPAHHDAEAL